MKFKRTFAACASAAAIAVSAVGVNAFVSNNSQVSAASLDSMNAMELVNSMGAGYNLGNVLDAHDTNRQFTNPEEQMTSWGNSVPTKETIHQIHKQGFDTIRIPITWYKWIDDKGNVDEKWMTAVKQVVDWAIEDGMYVIINVHHDGVDSQGYGWLGDGKTNVKTKFTGLWTNIANEFKDYDRHLVMEAMNEINWKNSSGGYDYEALTEMNQAFVDTVRATGGNNANRLLLIPGANTDLQQTCSSSYVMPTDKENMLAVSIHYYLPSQFCVESDKNPWTWTDDKGEVHTIEPMTKWGSEEDYKTLVSNFVTMEETYTTKGIPVILGECGVLTEEQKDSDSIREFLEAVYSMSANEDGFTTCLWDGGRDNACDMCFFYRFGEEYTCTAGKDAGQKVQPYSWYDEKLGTYFKGLKSGSYVSFDDYLKKTVKKVTVAGDSDTSTSVNSDGNLEVKIGTKKVSKITFNATIDETHKDWTSYNVGFGVGTSVNGKWTGTPVNGTSGVKQSDGTYTYTLSLSDLEGGTASDYIQIQKWWGNDAITSLNSVTVEYEGSTGTAEKTVITADLDYDGYKAAIKNFTPDVTESSETTEEVTTVPATTESTEEITTAVTETTEEITTTVTETTEEITTTVTETTEEITTSATEPTEEVTTAPAATESTEETNETPDKASKYGDVNLDGDVTIADTVLLNKYLVKSASLSGTGLANADACKDGKVNSTDTLAILKLIVGTYDKLPVTIVE